MEVEEKKEEKNILKVNYIRYRYHQKKDPESPAVVIQFDKDTSNQNNKYQLAASPY